MAKQWNVLDQPSQSPDLSPTVRFTGLRPDKKSKLCTLYNSSWAYQVRHKGKEDKGGIKRSITTLETTQTSSLFVIIHGFTITHSDKGKHFGRNYSFSLLR